MFVFPRHKKWNIFSIDIFYNVSLFCVFFVCARVIRRIIFHISERKRGFAFTRERSREQNEREVSFLIFFFCLFFIFFLFLFLLLTRPYVGRKRDGERDMRVFRSIWSHYRYRVSGTNFCYSRINWSTD